MSDRGRKRATERHHEESIREARRGRTVAFLGVVVALLGVIAAITVGLLQRSGGTGGGPHSPGEVKAGHELVTASAKEVRGRCWGSTFVPQPGAQALLSKPPPTDWTRIQ